jgi:hypothetical protein
MGERIRFFLSPVFNNTGIKQKELLFCLDKGTFSTLEIVELYGKRWDV